MTNESESFGNSQQVCPNTNCNFDHNEPNSNFCTLCGTLLYQNCDDCLKENARYAKFCHFCGTSLDDLRNFSSSFVQKETTEEIIEE